MEEQTVRAVLRIIAVGMIFIGAALTTQVLIVLVGTGRAFGDAAAQIGLTSVFAQLMLVTWGVVLFAASPTLASRIVE